MLSNYIKLAIRNLVKHKGFAVINLIGLALGIASGVLILIYVADELSFDKFHTKRDRIYRVGTDMVDINTGNLNGSIEGNGWPIGKLLEADFPEVEKVLYIANASQLQVNHEDKRFDERIYFADNSFFGFFDFPLIDGNPKTALSKPNTVVLTESISKKYFGTAEVLGKTLMLTDTLLFEVTGVMKDVPQQSHMQFGLLLSFETYKKLNPQFSFDDGWGNLNIRNYVMLKEGVDKDALFAKARNLYMNYVKEEMKGWGMYMYLGFESLDNLYLNSKRGNGMGPLGSMDRIYMVSGIAFFVIVLACINFINLATARSTNRAKEVGLRKVVGSSRKSLIYQFLGESFLTTVIALVIAAGLVFLVMPQFNQWVGKTYRMDMLLNPVVLLGMALLASPIEEFPTP